MDGLISEWLKTEKGFKVGFYDMVFSRVFSTVKISTCPLACTLIVLDPHILNLHNNSHHLTTVAMVTNTKLQDGHHGRYLFLFLRFA